MIFTYETNSPLAKSYHGTSPVAQMVKNPPESTGNAGNLGWIPQSGKSPGEGNDNLLQYSCLENSMDKGAFYSPWGLEKS